MSDQLVLDLDGYCPPAPITTANNGGTSGSLSGGSGGIITTPLYGYIGGALPRTIPVVIGIDYGTKPATPKEKNKDGCTCKKCQEFFPYAESNQDDGSLICYGCKLWM